MTATVAIFVAAVQVASAKTLGAQDTTGTIIAVAAGIALRLTAYRRGWRLPRGLEWQPGRIGHWGARAADPVRLPVSVLIPGLARTRQTSADEAD